MQKIGLLFPHQLFPHHPIHDDCDVIYLLEEFLFFKHYAFHKQKIAFHRASMKAFENHLLQKGKKVKYINSIETYSDIREFIPKLASEEKIDCIYYIDPTDEWLSNRINTACVASDISTQIYNNPLFLNTKEDLASFFKPTKKSFFQTTFYKQQRKKRNILLDAADQPIGGKWTYDIENRKKYPKKKTPPSIQYPEKDEYWTEALAYVEKHFSHCPGQIDDYPIYPHTYRAAQTWFQQFLDFRFFDFGTYEDAIVQKEGILNHSVLTPMLNVGLLDVQSVLQESLDFALQQNIPINSTEGFVRQIIGWREFIRGMYECKGNISRTTNFWDFKRKIPQSFYDGTTGIIPIDQTIQKVLKTGYCHHIERLMVLGNFMLLCEFDPDEVYRWFMELFIDAYDWVMVPNVYGMSQFADGGFFATKPYISGSNYLKKMSDYGNGDWQKTWDGLFWRFMHVHGDFFKKNPRLSMLVHAYNRMSEEKKNEHLKNAEQFLGILDE